MVSLAVIAAPPLVLAATVIVSVEPQAEAGRNLDTYVPLAPPLPPVRDVEAAPRLPDPPPAPALTTST